MDYNIEFDQMSIKEKIKNLFYNNKKVVIVLVCLVFVAIVLILIISLTSKKPNNSNLKYQSIETVMKLNAEEYFKKNKTVSDMYVSLNNLNLKIDAELACENLSGVLKEKDNYYPYLMCEKYNSNSIKNILKENENNKEYGTLVGANPYILTNDEYTELGYDIDSKYTVNIKGNDIENGLNIINYYILENNKYVAELKRIVIAEDIQGNYPIIELIGNKTRTIPQNSLYKELGVIATDKIDGDLKDKVQTIGTVDTSKSGTYIITYQVTNSKGFTTTVTRTVIVNQTEVTLGITHTISPTTITDEGVTITLNITGEGYEKTVFQNGTESTSKTPTYVVRKNGTYEFVIYDINNNSEVYEVEINNLDTTGPVVSCTGVIKNKNTTITITSDDDAEYFILNNGAFNSEKVTNKTYTFAGEHKNVVLKAYDKLDNKTEVTCDVKSALIKDTITNCNLTKIQNMKIRLINASTKHTAGSSAFPGGATYSGSVKMANQTIDYEDYIKGVVPAEVSGLIKEEKYEGLKLFMIIINTFVSRSFNGGGKNYIKNGELRIEITSTYQVYNQYKYDNLSDEKKAILARAYQEIKDLVIYDDSTQKLSPGYYNSTFQNELVDATQPGVTLEDLFNATFFREYNTPHISSAGKIYANAVIYQCK